MISIDHQSYKIQNREMSKPFHGIKFCSTSIPSELRSIIASKIKSMGGLHVSNLMSDVNVLIVGDRNTEKYLFCVKKRFDIIFINSDTITKLHESWLNNNAGISYKLEDHSLPTFDDLNICFSRVSKDEVIEKDRQTLIDTLKSNGATVTDSLTNTSSCIITNEKSGKRYQVAKKWKIPVIHPIWIEHSLKRKAALNFTYYDIDNLPIEKLGQEACEVWKELEVDRKRKLADDDTNDNDEQHGEADDDLTIKRKNPKLWSTIMNDTKKLNTASKSKNHVWDEGEEKDDDETPQLSDVPKTSRFLTELTNDSYKSKLFKGKTFSVRFFQESQEKILKKVIESHHGIILNTQVSTKEPEFVIIPSNYDKYKLPVELRESTKSTVLTEWFIERSLHYNELKIDTWGEPFYHDNFNKRHIALDVSITGFQGIELLHLSKLITYLKFNKMENFHPKVDILIINLDILNLKKNCDYLTIKNPSLFHKMSNIPTSSLNSTKSKMKLSKSKNIPILTISFLFEWFFNEDEQSVININNRDWCIYCPKAQNIKPKLQSLMIIDDASKSAKANESVSKEQENQEHISDSLPKLPSPIKNKRNNWGRLIGRAPVSQFTNSTDSTTTSRSPFNDVDLNESKDEELNYTQIGYEVENTNEKLLELINGENADTTNKNPKKSSTTESIFSKRTTRAGYKDLMNIDSR